MVLMQQSKVPVITEAAVIAMQDHAGLINRAFLHGLTTHTDGLSVVFFPSSACKACGEEFVNRTKLHNVGQRGRELAVLPAQACWFLMWKRIIITSFSTMGKIITVEFFISSRCFCIDFGMVVRNTIHPNQIEKLDLSTRVS